MDSGTSKRKTTTPHKTRRVVFGSLYRVRVNITGKAAHSGMHYAHGRSAIREAAYKILQLEKASDEKRITYNCGKIEGGKAENILLS
jgi:metal-dependent amidase/aminoacylase/carboxypeptidase family protein